jgi:hypothetical protein
MDAVGLAGASDRQYDCNHYIVGYSNERNRDRIRMAVMWRDLGFNPGSNPVAVDNFFLWFPAKEEFQEDLVRRTFVSDWRTGLSYHHSLLIRRPGLADLAILRLTADSSENDSQTYGLQLFNLNGEIAQEIPDVPRPLPSLWSHYSDQYFIPLDPPSGVPTHIAYWSHPNEVLNVIDLEEGTVEQPCGQQSNDVYDYHRLLAYDYESGISLWYESPPDSTGAGFGFHTRDGQVTWHDLSELGIDLSHNPYGDSIFRASDFPPVVTCLGWHVSRIKDVPVACFAFAGEYLAIRLTPEPPEDGWIVWQKPFTFNATEQSYVGRLKTPTPDDPGDCWVMWDFDGSYQVVDLATGETVATGGFETASRFDLTGQEYAKGCLAVGEAGPDMPQDLFWWDQGAMILREYRLEVQ